uniref:Expansin-like EG45 domain-containing protein n=1 Tax=Tetradesmus obliquus TaxID=3088 RepID=A0A383W8D1_TETOB|eukprot:jgi/Sobl393_1/10302/SZX64918.1
MAAGPRPTLLFAAFALLLVMASCSDRSLLNRRRRKTSPAPDTPLYSFAWASISSTPAGTCEAACSNYGFAPIQSTDAALCSYASGEAKGTVYGTWTDDTCKAAKPDGTQIDSVTEGVTAVTCGCCGTLNRRGYKLSCPTNVVDYVASAGTCPASVAWTGSAGGDGTKICLRGTGAGGVEFGTISGPAPGNTCAIWDATPAATWQRVCMRVFK